MTLDIALGIGGLPRGRVIEVFGPEASGKTTLTLSAIKEIQRKGGVAAFIDAEHAFDSTYAKIIGVNLDELLISQPDTGEQALEITETLVLSEETKKKLNEYLKGEGLKEKFYPDGLTSQQVNYIKELFFKESNFNEVGIYKTFPLTPFLFLGRLVTIMARGIFLDLSSVTSVFRMMMGRFL